MKMLINGQQVDSSDKGVIQVRNPATQQVIDTVPKATSEDVNRAVECACQGFQTWSQVPLHQRIETLKRFHALYTQHRQELIESVIREAGKPVRAATAEINFSGEFIEHYTEQARFLGGETYPLSNRVKSDGDLLLTVREPLGVMVGLMPFNYPVSQLPHKIIAPLLMGNAVILKPASETPLVAMLFVRLLWEAGVPGNAVQVITGSGASIGNQLCLDPRVSSVSLTGSTEVGIEIAKAAANNLHHVKLELGGNDPLIILEDADLEYAVAESVAGRSVANAGQACCASKRFIVSNKIKAAYTEKLIAKLKTLKTGDPADPKTDFGPVINPAAAQTALRQIDAAVQAGARLLLGGKCTNETFVELTVLEITPDMEIARDEEVFAPVWPIIGFDTVDEAIQIANNTKYGLSSGVIGKDMQQLMKVAKSVQAGACVVNGTGDYRSYDQAFGGYKMTGLGREGARHTLESVTQLKTIVLRKCF